MVDGGDGWLGERGGLSGRSKLILREGEMVDGGDGLLGECGGLVHWALKGGARSSSRIGNGGGKLRGGDRLGEVSLRWLTGIEVVL